MWGRQIARLLRPWTISFRDVVIWEKIKACWLLWPMVHSQQSFPFSSKYMEWCCTLIGILDLVLRSVDYSELVGLVLGDGCIVGDCLLCYCLLRSEWKSIKLLNRCLKCFNSFYFIVLKIINMIFGNYFIILFNFQWCRLS